MMIKKRAVGWGWLMGKAWNSETECFSGLGREKVTAKLRWFRRVGSRDTTM